MMAHRLPFHNSRGLKGARNNDEGDNDEDCDNGSENSGEDGGDASQPDTVTGDELGAPASGTEQTI